MGLLITLFGLLSLCFQRFFFLTWEQLSPKPIPAAGVRDPSMQHARRWS